MITISHLSTVGTGSGVIFNHFVIQAVHPYEDEAQPSSSQTHCWELLILEDDIHTGAAQVQVAEELSVRITTSWNS